MNGNDLLNAMENVDDKHILAAEKSPKKRRLFIPALSVAAAAVITVTAGIVSLNQAPKIDENLPKVEATLTNQGMGFEGYHSLEEAENDNPWRESMDLKTLPVYRTDVFDPDYDIMLSKLENIAKAFGEDFSAMRIDDSFVTEEDKAQITEQFKGHGASDEEIQRYIRNVITHASTITASNDNIYINIGPDYTTTVLFEGGGIKIPDEYLESSPEKDKLERMAEYIFENYGNVINIKDPVRGSHGDHRSDGYINFYAGGSNDEELIYGYNFQYVGMGFNMDENKLDVLHINTKENGLEKLGDYPLISVKDAEKLLLNGNYLSSRVDYEPTSDDPIGKVELMYLSGRGYEFAMPFYRFLVGVSDGSEELVYTAYYVPAIRGEYLTEMPSQLTFNGGVVDTLKK